MLRAYNFATQQVLVTAESLAGTSDVSPQDARKQRSWPRMVAFAVIVAAAVALAIALGR